MAQKKKTSLSLKEILAGLNPEQKQAVLHKNGPALIIAGAGTGKTTVITRRIAYLITSKIAKPQEVLALTFTDKSADAMESRVDVLVSYGYTDTMISTFHAFGDRILREHALDLGLRPDYRVMNKTEQQVFFQSHLFKFPLKHYRSLGDPAKHIEALLNAISRAKDEDIAPDKYLAWASKKKDAEQIEVAQVYKKYQELKAKKGLIDFGDQVVLCLELFRKKPKILKKYQERFKYILVDEFQDTNYSQYQLLRLLSGKNGNIVVVGDDDQCLPPDSIVNTPVGKKKIKAIKEGEKVLTAVGKGFLSFSRVNKVFKNKKHCRLITFETKSGRKITVTSNHKMFCFVPSRRHLKTDVHYVYLMHRSDLGWRLGVTNDLSVRLKLERSADRIIGIKACTSDTEARYYETLWALKYGIPTVCFQERGDVAIKGVWLRKLYDEIDTELKVKRLAYDLDIDLNAHHFCLGAVNRGNKKRIKINLTMCYRRNYPKPGKSGILLNPMVIHQVYVETSDPRTIKKLRMAGFSLSRAKKGFRFRATSIDLQEIGKIAQSLCVVTGGILEVQFNVGTLCRQHLASLMMPASNVLVGHCLPIVVGKRVVYDPIVKVCSKEEEQTVYDLEVDRTHNFVADGVVVHNSIYKFRGAAISNILNFAKDYPKTKKVVLSKNYRSTQLILDTAYKLIQFNNPDRLEVKANVNKKLSAFVKTSADKKKSAKAVVHKQFDTVYAEADWVASQIKEKYESGDYRLKDFAILTRANRDAEPFIKALNVAGIPSLFSGAGGLYSNPEIKLVLSFLRVIGDLADSISLYSLAASQIYKVDPLDLQKLNTFAQRRNFTLHHVFTHLDDATAEYAVLGDLKEDTRAKVRSIMADIAFYLDYAKERTTGEVLYKFLNSSGYLKGLTMERTAKSEYQIQNIAKFFEKVTEFKTVAELDRVSEFVKYLNVLKEAGDDPESAGVDPDVDAVNVLTVHKAKGLEFSVVFMVSLVSEKFPVRAKSDPIEIPADLLKDTLPSGDFHLQEERRLFYVAMTRAKQELYFTSSLDYGGKRLRKVSQFVLEALDLPKADLSVIKKTPLDQIELFAEAPDVVYPQEKQMKEDEVLNLSFYHIDDYLTCPLKYKYIHILKVPLLPHHAIIYGAALHQAVQAYHLAKKNGNKFTLKDLLAVFTDNWKSEGFISREHEEERLKVGKLALARFFKEQEKLKIIPKFIEEPFKVIKDHIQVKGRMDRVDEVKGKIHIIDFKSSDVRTQEDADKKVKENLQLGIYALAWKELYKKLPDSVELHFLETGVVGAMHKTEQDIAKVWEKIQKVADGLRKGKYQAKPSSVICGYCPYNELCPESAM